MNIYSIRDARTGFLHPTFEVNDAVAARNFEHAVVNSDSVLFSHASDFSLYRLGLFDEESGQITPDPMPVFVINGADVLAGKESSK